MSDSTLLALYDEVRGKTLELLAGVGERKSLWAPPGLHNSIRWHAGHCYVVVEVLCAKALETSPQCPAGWFELFSCECRPESPGGRDAPARGAGSEFVGIIKPALG